MRHLLLFVLLVGCRPAERSSAAEPTPASPRGDAPDSAAPRQAAEATSLFGRPLLPPVLPDDVRVVREQELANASKVFDADPTNLDAIIWYGRRLAYLGRYREALTVFSDGLRIYPDSARLLRHRGHRFITVRRFDDAVADLERSAQLMVSDPDEVEIDGLPNAAGVPTGTLYTNVWYHLALAHYLKGDLARATEAWEACWDAAKTDDMRIAAAYWLTIALQRKGDTEGATSVLARVPAEPVLHENFAYHELLRLFRGDIGVDGVREAMKSEVDQATIGYGLAHFHRMRGDSDRTREELERVLATPQWAAFGYLAAEVDLFALG